MSNLVTGKPDPNLRVVTGRAEEVEILLNQLLDDYSALQFYWATIDGAVHLSALLMHNRIINRQQLLAAAIPGRR